MKKNFKILILVLIAMVTLGMHFMPSVPFVLADSGSVDYGYTITNYHTQIVVLPSNTLIVKEEIEVEFGSLSAYGESRGIYRYIPTKLTVTRDKGGVWQDYTYGVKVNLKNAVNVESGISYEEAYEENDNLVILIREPNLVNGKTRNYVIEYEYNIGYDRVSTHDELYYNLLGDKWDTTIERFSFSVTMPYDFTGTPSFYTGKYGNSDKSLTVQGEVNGRVISGYTVKPIQPFNALTIKLDLPEGYFDQAKGFNAVWDVVLLVVTGLVTLGIVLYYIKYRKHKPVVQVVEFYPPNDIDPAHLVYALNGVVTVKQLTSLIVYFASVGYLKIIEKEKEIELQKLKDIPESAPSYQKSIFNALFKKKSEKAENILDLASQIKKSLAGEEIDEQEEDVTEPVKLKDLQKRSSVSSAFTSATLTVNTECGPRLEKKTVWQSLIMKFVSVLPLIMFFIGYSVRVGVWVNEGFTILIGILVLAFIILIHYVRNETGVMYYKRGKKALFGAGMFTLILIGFILVKVFWETVLDPFGLKIITLLPILVGAMLAPKMVQFTEEYRDLFGRILGFKKNIVLVEKKRMEMLLKDDPSYFYHVLPYAYVLGITNEFVKNFEGLTLTQPDWFVSYNNSVFNYIIFSNLINSSLTNFSTKVISSSVNSGYSGRSSGGGFGGGFSGGGFGGGGGGRA